MRPGPSVVRLPVDHQGVGEIDVPDRQLGDGPLVVGGLEAIVLVEGLVAGRVAQPLTFVDAPDDRLDLHVETSRAVDLSGDAGHHRAGDRKRHGFGFDGRVEGQNDPVDVGAAVQGPQQGQHVLAQGTRQTSVIECGLRCARGLLTVEVDRRDRSHDGSGLHQA